MPKNVMCKRCNNLVNGWCEKVIDSPDPDMQRDCQHFWEKTNADRIRAMSDEELAKWILQFVIDCTELTLGEDCRFEDGSEATMVEWLKQPAEGE